MKKIFIMSVGIIFLFLGASVVQAYPIAPETSRCLLQSEKTLAFDNWLYYRILSIDNAVDDYQMFMNISYSLNDEVNCNSHCKTDFSDIRFVNEDNSTQLNYWFEKIVDGKYCWVWIRLPEDIESSKKIIMFYGNQDAISESNGEDTFQYFEDWTIDHTSQWTVVRKPSDTGTVCTLPMDINYGIRYVSNIKWLQWDVAPNYTPDLFHGFFDSTGEVSPVNYLCSYTKPSMNAGADSSTLAYRLSIEKDGDMYFGTFQNPAFSLGQNYLSEITYSDSSMSSALYASESRTLLSRDLMNDNIPVDTSLHYLGFELGDYGESGHNQYFTWDSSGYLELFLHRGVGGTEHRLIDWMFIGKYVDPEPFVDSVGDERFNFELISSLLVGKIQNVTEFDSFIIFEAVKVRRLSFSPIGFSTLKSNEYIIIDKDYKGFIGLHFLFTFSKSYVMS